MLFVVHGKKKPSKKNPDIVIKLNKKQFRLRADKTKKKTKVHNLVNTFKKTAGKKEWGDVETYTRLAEKYRGKNDPLAAAFRKNLALHTYSFYEKLFKYAVQKKAPADFIELLRKEVEKMKKRKQ